MANAYPSTTEARERSDESRGQDTVMVFNMNPLIVIANLLFVFAFCVLVSFIYDTVNDDKTSIWISVTIGGLALLSFIWRTIVVQGWILKISIDTNTGEMSILQLFRFSLRRITLQQAEYKLEIKREYVARTIFRTVMIVSSTKVVPLKVGTWSEGWRERDLKRLVDVVSKAIPGDE